MLFLQPFIQPSEEGALPEHAVLRFEYPVVLVGEDEKFGWDAAQTCCVECTEALVGVDAVVHLTVDAEDRCIPLVDELMR